MLRIHIHSDAAKVSAYHADHLSADSSKQQYYCEDNRLIGQWFGIGAAKLGRFGEVSKADFDSLCRNRNPETNGTLTVRKTDNARAAYDFCFSAPKSVSTLALVTGDGRIVEAHDKAVKETLQELEKLAMTRVRGDGACGDRFTGNIVAALFRHTTSRAASPSDVSDPQLHTHAIVFNATYDAGESRWKALQTLEIYRKCGLATSIYRNRLAAELHQMGYMTVATGKTFEVSAVPKEVIGVFSKRHKQIDALEKDRGVSGNAALRASIAQKSRARKDCSKTPEELVKDWLAQLTAEQVHHLNALKAGACSPVRPGQQFTADGALDLAARHLFERRSVIKKDELFRYALIISCGQHDLAAFQNALDNAGTKYLFREDEITTQAALDAELQMIKFVNNNANRFCPLNADFVPSAELYPDQAEAVRKLLSCRGQVMLLDGPPGAGKSWTLVDIARGLRAKGHEYVVCAPTGAAAADLRTDGFLGAMTLERLLTDKERQKELDGAVIVLDEAGLVAVPKLNELFALAQLHKCRILLSGSAKQHKSVSWGDSLRVLLTHSVLERVSLSKIIRQKHKEYLAAIYEIEKGDLVEGLAQLEILGWINEVDDADRYKRVASDYLSVITAKENNTCLAVCATWRESELVTEKVRELMREKRLLLGPDVRMRVLTPLSFTEGQREQCNSYETGQVIVFQRKSRLCARGECLEVVSVDDGFVKVRNQASEVLLLDPRKVGKSISVFTTKEMPVAKGDDLLLRANGVAKDGARLVNGERVTVKAISTKGEITLSDGRIVPSEFRHFCAGYAISSQSSQGKTVDVVLIAIDANSAAAATTQETLYVAASRGRHRCTIYTDAKEKLFDAFTRSSERQAAVEFMQEQIYEKQQPHPSPGTAARKSLPEARLAPPSQTKRQHHLREELRRRVDTAVRLKRVHSHARNQGAALQNEQPVRGLPGGGGGLPLPSTDLARDRRFLPSLGR